MGPLLVVAGFTLAVSALQWATPALPYTVGQLFDLIPAAVFVHVFLAFTLAGVSLTGALLVLTPRGERVACPAARSPCWSIPSRWGC